MAPCLQPSSIRRLVTPARALLVFLILLNLVYFGLYANQRYLAFESGAFDLGVYVQPLWNFIQGRGFAISLVDDNGSLRWATHVEPILFLIAPLYKLWPDPRMLLWLQVIALSLAALPLFALAVRRLQNEWVALAIVLAYFLLPATESVTLFDFHAVALAPLFLLAALYFLDRALAARGKSLWLWPPANSYPAGPKSQLKADEGTSTGHSPSTGAYLLATFFFLLALSTKEDISLHVFMIGLYLLLLRRLGWEGGSLIVVGLAWFYVTFQLIIPAFRTAGGQSIYISWFEALGNTPLEIALSPLTAPDKVLAFLFRADSLPPLSMITLPLALLPLAGLPFLALAAPSLAFSLLSQNPTLRQLETWHYAAPMLPFIMLATIDGLARVSHYVARCVSTGWFGRPIPGRSAARAIQGAPGFAPRPVVMAFLSVALLATSLAYHYLRGYSALSQWPAWPRVTAHHQLGRELAALIPPEASVLAQAELVPYVAHRREVRIWSGPLYTDYDYVWLDLSHPKLPNRFNAHGEFLTGLVIENAFGPVAAKDGYLLLKKGAARQPIPEELFTFTQFDQIPAGAQPFGAVFGDTFKLVAVKPEVPHLATSETEPQVILYFEVLQKPAQDYQLFVYLLDETGAVTGATDYPQPAIFWWPTSRWEAGDRRQVRVNTIPWWTGDNMLWGPEDKAAFGYALGFSRSNAPWDISARLPVTGVDDKVNPPGSRPIDHDTLLPIVAFHRRGGLPVPGPLAGLQSGSSESQMVNNR